MVSTADGGEAETKHRLSLAVAMSLAVALATSGCFTSGSLDPGRTSLRPLDEFGVRAESVTAPATTATTPSTATTTRQHRPGYPTRPGQAATTVAAASEKPTAWRSVLRLSDPPSDLGLTRSPPYADFTGMRIEDGGKRARLTVTLAGRVPARLPDGEVVGIGIDVFRANTRESDYQVFLDGGADGWRAFLHTPEGLARFPGTLAVSGRQLISEMPWSSLGGRASGRVSAFADWSAQGAVNPSSHDILPDAGTRRFTVR